jgi:hypothetical protein
LTKPILPSDAKPLPKGRVVVPLEGGGFLTVPKRTAKKTARLAKVLKNMRDRSRNRVLAIQVWIAWRTPEWLSQRH